MQVLGLAARAMADSRMSLEARLKSKFNLQQTGGAADVVVASAAAGLVDDPYAFPDVDVCRAPVPTGRLPGPVTPHPTPIARLYPELAEKLERARSQPAEPRGVGTAAPPPPAASCAPGARAGGPVGAREDGRTMARLQTKIAQNKLKERLKQRGRELKGASRPAGKGAGDRWAGYGAVQRPFGDTNGAASPTRLLSANRADVLYSPPGVFGAGTPLGTDTPLGAGTTPLGVVTPLGAAGTDVGTGSAFSALFAGLERPLPLGLSPAPSAPSACVTRVAFPDSWTEIGAASRLPHAPCATAKPAERKWRKADARSRPAGRRARDPSAETGRKAARRGAASSRAGSRKAGAAGTASGRPRPRGRKSADPVVVEPRTPVIEDVAGPPAGPTPLWPPVGEAWMACGDDPRLTVGELQPPTAAAVVAAAAASPMRGDVPLRSPHSAAASRVPPCAARGADETPPAPPYTCLRTRCPPVPDAAAAAEARVKSRLRHRSALLMYESFLKQTVVDVNLLPVGADSSNDDDSDLDDTLPWQQEWVLTSSEEDNDDDDLDTGIPSAIRLTKVSLLRSKLRRQLLQLRRCRHANGALRRRQQVALRAALRASRCCPAEATAVVVALTASRGDTARGKPHMHRSDDGGGPSSQTCLHRGAEEEEVCGRTALPFANHCLRHIMYNVDQQIFDLCTAKFADNTQCCVPAFDLRHELPLCAEHAAKADNYQRSHGTRPKKPRKKTKPSALTRPPKKGKKKRNMKKAVLAQIPSPPPRPHAEVTDEPHFSVDVEVSSPRRQNSNDLQNDLQNDLDEDILDNSLDNDDLDDSFSPGVMEKNLEFDTGTELLDEHDLHDVLNRLPEAFDLFNGRTGFVPSREDAEALERALAQVSQELCDANESLALLDHTGAPPDTDELTKLLDGEQLSAAAAALDENLSALASSITATDLHNLSQVLTNSELTRALEGGPRPSDVRHCDVRPCDVRPCDIRPYDVRPYDIRLCDVRPCDVRSGDIRPCDVRPCDVRPCDIRPSIVCPSDTRLCDIRPSIDLSSDVRPSILPSDVRPSILLSSDVRPSIILPSDLRPSMLLPSDVRPSIIISSDVRPSVFVPSDVRPSVFVSSDVRPSVFVPSDVRPSVFVPSDVRPSITIPSDVRPSVFVPSDVRPSVFVPSDMQPSEMRCCDVRPPGPPGGARPCLPVLQAQLARRPFHEPLLLSPAALRFPPPPGGRARTDAVAAASWRVAPPGVNGLPPMSCAFRLAAPLPPPPAALSPAKLPPLHALLPAAGDAATNTLLLPPSVTLHPPFSLPYALPLPGNGAQQRRPYPDT